MIAIAVVVLIILIPIGVMVWKAYMGKRSLDARKGGSPRAVVVDDIDIDAMLAELESTPLETLNAELETETDRNRSLAEKLEAARQLLEMRKKNEGIAAELAGASQPAQPAEEASPAPQPVASGGLKILSPGNFPPNSRVIMPRKGHKAPRYW